MQILLNVSETKLTLTSPVTLVSTQVNYDTCEFSFGAEWDGYTKTAVFYSNVNKEPIAMLLSDSNACDIPWESMETAGILYIGVFGIKDNTEIPTNFIILRLEKGSAGNNTPPPPSLDIYAQIINKVSELKLDVATGTDLHDILQSTIDDGNITDASLKEGIALGNLLDVVLKTDIGLGNTLDLSLKDGIAEGNITDASLKESIVLGNATDVDLKADIVLAGQNSFATEIETSRGGEVDLPTRLNKSDAQLAENTKKTDTVAYVRLLGAKGDGVTDDTQAFKDAKGANSVINLQTGHYIISELLDLSGYNIVGDGVDMAIIEFNTPTPLIDGIVLSGKNKSYRGFTIFSPDGNIDYPLSISTTRSIFENIKVYGKAVALIKNSAWINSFRDVYTWSNGTDGTRGIQLEGSSNSIIIQGGELMSEYGIVVEGGHSIHIDTCIEGPGGTNTEGKGVVINNGSDIKVGGYFEDKGIQVNGGKIIDLNNIIIMNNTAPIIINGGENILIDNIMFSNDFPRVPIKIGTGLENQVTIGKLSFSNPQKMVATNSKVISPFMGRKILNDGNFDNWTGNIFNGEVYSAIGGTITKSEETLHGRYAMKWELSTGGSTSTLGVLFNLNNYIPDVKGKKITIGAWLYLSATDPTKNGCLQINSNSAILKTATQYTYDLWNDNWIFTTISLDVPIDITDFKLFVIGKMTNVTSVGTESIIIDSLHIVEGLLPSTPFTTY